MYTLFSRNNYEDEHQINVENDITKVEVVNFEGLDVPLLHVETVALRGAYDFQLYRFDNTFCVLLIESMVVSGSGAGYDRIVDYYVLNLLEYPDAPAIQKALTKISPVDVEIDYEIIDYDTVINTVVVSYK